MSPEAQDHLFARLDLDPVERERAQELDDEDLRVLAAMVGAPATSQAVAEASGVSIDRTNIALSRLLRLKVVKLEQSQWHVLEDVR
jgi:hypothetical protein